MKFPLGFEVELARPGGAAYADITHGQDRYVVGVPGQPFEVRVTAPPKQFISPYMRIVLTVDGLSVGVSKIISARHHATVFDGFVTAVKGQNCTRQFLFGKAETAFDGPAAAPGASKTGGIAVTFTAVQEAPGYVQPAALPAHQSAAPLRPVEGKKWFMQPSLSAQQGQITGSPVTFSTKRYNDVRLLTTCEMRMETAAILILRKVLNPDFPLHQAIIDQSEEPEEEDQEGSSNQNVPAAANDTAASSARVGIKRERSSMGCVPNRAIKREANSRTAPANEDFGVIDLT